MSWMWPSMRPWMPWIITSVSVAYVLYIHHKLRRQSSTSSADNPSMNPFIDKHKQKVKHVLKGEDLEKDDNEETNCHNTNGTTSTSGVQCEECDESRPRGRRSAYSYFVSECADSESNPLCLSADDRLIFAEFAKKCAHNWKKLSEEQKQYYHQLSETDKKRYDSEMKRYRKQRSKQSKSICKKKVIEDISEDNLLNMAFDLFAGEEMPVVRGQRPSITDNNEEILSELLVRWDKSEVDFKNHYLDRIRQESAAFNMSFNTSIKDEDDLSVDGLAVDNTCGSDPEPEAKSYRCAGAGDPRRSHFATAPTRSTTRSTTTTSDPSILNGATSRTTTSSPRH